MLAFTAATDENISVISMIFRGASIMWKIQSAIGVVLVWAASANAELPDLAKLNRKILKEPSYTAKQPLYGLLVFGPSADKRVWIVLDKSKRDASYYDILYVDRNADGDLTAPDKRLVAKTVEGSPLFALAKFKDPATDAIHSEFRVQLRGDQPTVMVTLKWRGKMEMGGGYPPDPGEYMRLSPKPEMAPVVWFQGDGPFRFQRWYGGTLSIGGADDFKVFLGQIGWGQSSFCAFREHVLPAGEAVQATLIYTDKSGKECREICPLKERC
jgi:hypothetical protein